MDKELKDFIAELFQSMGIPVKRIPGAAGDWFWLDQGLRTKVLGISPDEWNARVDGLVSSLEDATVYHIADLFHCCYTCAKLPDEKGYLFLGPVLFDRIPDNQLDGLLEELGLPESLRIPMQNYYYSICFLPYQTMYDNLIALAADRIYGKNQYRVQYADTNTLDEWREFRQNKWSAPSAPFVNIRFIEDRYKLENAIMQAVAGGNETGALDFSRQFQALLLPQRLDNALRDHKDYTITLNTLLRKAAEQGGVHPIHIDNLSNNNIERIEQMTSVEQCKLFQRKMIRLYCRLVKENNLQSHSLPIRKVITYIRTDLTADLSLKSMAEQLSVNASYLSSLFKKEMGIPLTEYVNTCRIRHAQMLLLNTDLPTKSIALQCGISDMYYFSRMFKRIAGMTPKTYREKTRAENREWLRALPAPVREEPH